MQKDKLPVLEIIYKSIAYPWYYRKDLSLALLPMFVALACLQLAFFYLPGADFIARTLMFYLISFPLTILFAITVHRFLILGPDSIRKFGVFEWRGREWNFLFYSIGLGFLLAVMATLPVVILRSGNASGENFLSWMALFMACLPAFLVFARLSLVFPATAVDLDFSLSEAWKAGRGNTIRLALVVYAVPATSSAFNHLLPGQVNQNFEALLVVAGTVVGYIMCIIEVACLSFAYKYLIALPEENNP